MLTKRILLLHDNARPHTAAQTRELIASFDWEGLEHPPYSPDLAPSDFHVFKHLKHHLGGKHYNNNEEVKMAINLWLLEQAENFFEEGLESLVLRYDKFLNKQGDCVGK